MTGKNGEEFHRAYASQCILRDILTSCPRHVICDQRHRERGVVDHCRSEVGLPIAEAVNLKL
jgi:hypothetical protein